MVIISSDNGMECAHWWLSDDALYGVLYFVNVYALQALVVAGVLVNSFALGLLYSPPRVPSGLHIDPQGVAHLTSTCRRLRVPQRAARRQHSAAVVTVHQGLALPVRLRCTAGSVALARGEQQCGKR